MERLLKWRKIINMSSVVMCRARLGSKARAWARLETARACGKDEPGPSLNRNTVAMRVSIEFGEKKINSVHLKWESQRSYPYSTLS